jgi:hypothetical protein
MNISTDVQFMVYIICFMNEHNTPTQAYFVRDYIEDCYKTKIRHARSTGTLALV